jgi:hypothetical protein
MIGFFSTTSPVRRWLTSMQIDGQWLLCDGGIVRPVIRGVILARAGLWVPSAFLVDTGADRTVFSAEVTVRHTSPAGWRPLPMSQVRGRLAPPDWRGKGSTPSLGTWRTFSQGFLKAWQGRGQRCFIELIG